MKYIKTFENINLQLKKGDYVYCQVDEKSKNYKDRTYKDEINKILKDNIGEIDYHRLTNDNYVVDFKTITNYPKMIYPELEKYDFKQSIGPNWKYYYKEFSKNDIKFCSPDKQEVENYIETIDKLNKFNI